MGKNVFVEKRYLFLVFTAFFFLLMLFLYLNISNRMYSNSGILLSVSAVNNLRLSIDKIENNIKTDNEEAFIKLLDDFINHFEFYPSIASLKVYDNENSLILHKGRSIILEKTIDYSQYKSRQTLYNKTHIRNSNYRVYQIITFMNDSDIGYIDIIFDLKALEDKLYPQKQVLFVIIFIINFIIVFFLIIMIVNLQGTIVLYKRKQKILLQYDENTGLLTKQAFFQNLKKEIDRMSQNNGRIVIIVADIDNFSKINAVYGNDFGDAVLKAVASIFKSSFRSFDVVGCLGSDEIIVMMSDLSVEEGAFYIRKCMDNIINNKFYIHNQEVTITVSSGMTSSETFDYSNGFDKQRLFRFLYFNSLNALQKAKKMGVNQVWSKSLNP